MATVITKQQRYGIIGVVIGLLVTAVIVIGALGGDDSETVRTADSPAASGAGESTGGAPAAEVAAQSDLPTESFELFSGENSTFAAFEGTPLVINFWASWCPACVGELPDFQSVHSDRADEVTFLGIANADVRPAAERLAADVGLTYTLADDPNGDLFREFELFAMPSTIFVSPQGEILEVFAGQLNEEALNERIDKLVANS